MNTLFPPDIVRLIESYDSTKYETYARVLHQFRMRRVFWLHFYSPKPWISQFFQEINDAEVNRWLFRGEEFFWEMYSPPEYEAYVEWRCHLHAHARPAMSLSPCKTTTPPS